MRGFPLIWYNFPTRGRGSPAKNGTKKGMYQVLIKFEADQATVDYLKVFTGQATASKAFLSAAQSAVELSAEVRQLRAELERVTETLAVQSRVIDQARSSAAQLLEHCAQSDLFNLGKM